MTNNHYYSTEVKKTVCIC